MTTAQNKPITLAKSMEVPPDWNAAAIEATHSKALAPHPRGQEAMRLAHAGFGALHGGLDAILTAAGAVDAAAPQVAGRRVVDPVVAEKFRTASERRFVDAVVVAERSIAGLAATATALRTEIAAALKSPDKQHAQEIRRHCKSLKATERLNFISEAIGRGDLMTVDAVLNAPSFLSGIPDDLAASFRRDAEAKIAPVASAALGQVGRAIAQLEGARGLFATKVGDVADRFAPTAGAQKVADALGALAALDGAAS